MLKNDFEKQIDSLKIQHELSIKRLNNEIEKLHGEKHALFSELENKHNQFRANAFSSTEKHNNVHNYKPNGSNGSYSNGGKLEFLIANLGFKNYRVFCKNHSK